MPRDESDVEALVIALFTLNAGLDRARRERKGASALALLQVVPADHPIRPSEIAARQHVEPSLVSRQVREMEDAGYLRVSSNPADGRSCLVSLTPAGADELRRLAKLGLERFALFVQDWESAEVRTLTELLGKLQRSMAATNRTEERPTGRRWAQRTEAQM